MLIGMMNDPRKDVVEEARWAAEHGFDFLDLTIEGPAAALEQIDVVALKQVLNEAHMQVVGHTAWFLPFASPVGRVRRAAVEEVAAALPIFADLGVKLVNVHIVRGVGSFGYANMLALNGKSFAELAELAEPHGIRIMVEHPPESGLHVDDIRKILNADARLGFHLDVGHANVGGDRLEVLLKAFNQRLCHVHVSDNRGRSDDHMPLGAGSIDWPKVIHLLKKSGYDGTITLEVFVQDRDWLLHSAEKLREWWADK
ncbi:MAG: sugar phosphate isomerase/epimerase [Chloroflexi bacterium AL-W]|nr:sugar phosphate isomerase/epimerase [Chloroflexi bacterium AL-N1]NOK68651.1 sugar phosphate isomerase/epimerase [Chloroflexi bacterium AL-N10]NOK76137.1 sugar phosphate isomerase/epimerase [Chloroflexi bacterium AL-N5]NOK84226.1 sugar phosphate isomerase/epimerase [Chloroflexi bacterium AL-W]NOK91275.1 sugar phosphate isomerase/epimerase [Chloroflexi bacterium AL-N15]